jgi:hypothetical protein
MRKSVQTKDYEREDVWCALWGNRFIPSQLRVSGQIEIADANDPGDIGTLGRYRGEPTPYGSCNVRCTIRGRKKIGYLATHLRRNLARYRRHGATSIVYWILWRGIQGNMELTVQELRKLADMKVAVAMDYIQMET